MLEALREAIKFIVVLIGSIIVILLVFCVWRTWATGDGPRYERFLEGFAPTQFPDGFYAGEVMEGPQGNWRGKVFNAEHGTGLNVFDENGWRAERYVFRMTRGPGLREKKQIVLKLDYNLRENPWWLRPVLDELIVERDGTLYGKMHLRIIPNVPFTITYFTMKP